MTARVASLIVALSLLGCEGDVSLAITDAPIDEASRVVISLRSVSFLRSDGSDHRVNFNDPLSITLSELFGGRTQTLVSGENVPAGDYTGVEIALEADSQQLDSFIELDEGGQVSLIVASGESLRAERSFTVKEDESLTLTLEFDLRQSITNTDNGSGDRLLRPALRLVRDDQTGSIVGKIDAELLSNSNCDNGINNDEGNVIYLFNGSGVTPDDIDGILPDPLTTATVSLDAVTGEPEYVLAFIEAGSYTLALSCQGRNDDPELSDDLNFATTLDVTVEAGRASAVDL